MNRKQYIKPKAAIIKVNLQHLCASSPMVSCDYGVLYDFQEGEEI